MRSLTTAIYCALAAQLHAAEAVDLNKFDRRLAKEPSYAAGEPLYGLVVFGPQAETRVWMVLDKSDADRDVFDLLYADLNGNGDLTDAAERFMDENATASSSRFSLPDFTDPASGIKHTEFNLRATRGQQPTFMVSIKWRGELKFGGGYAEVPDDGYMSFAASAKEAPVVWINGDGPFRFQRWYSEKLRIGEADDFKVFLGQHGIGKNSFASFQCHALPFEEPVLATLVYQDKDGNEQHVGYELKERC
jgi:hypothetical protein